MKRLDAIITKLSKLPSAIWVIAVGLSYMFASLYSLATTTGQMIESVNEYMSKMAVEFTGFMNNLEWFFYIETAIIGLVIFEVIIAILYKYLYNRRYISANMPKFKTAARVFYSAANVVVGLFSLISFAAPVFDVYNTQVVSLVAYTAAYLAVYLAIKPTVINPKYVGTAFMKLFSFYFLIEGVFGGLNLILAATQQPNDMHTTISTSVAMAVLAALGILIYKFVALPLKKEELGYIEPTPPQQPPTSPPDEIFRGYGF